MKKVIFTAGLFIFVLNAYAQMRSFEQIFPAADEHILAASFTETGYVRASQRTSGFSLIGRQNSGIDPQIINIVLNRNPGYIIESITVIPVDPNTVSLLDIYNALGNIQDLKGRLYRSATRNEEVPLFEDATRIRSERQTSAIPDPPPARFVPQSETVYIRLRDINFGNTYYRGEMSIVQNGIRYTMTNFRNMTYLFVPVIREERFTAQLYFERITEGVLIYSIAGVDISDFFANRIHISSAIEKRLAVITTWAADGILKRN